MNKIEQNPTDQNNQVAKEDSVQADEQVSVSSTSTDKENVQPVPWARWNEQVKLTSKLKDELDTLKSDKEKSRIKAMEEQGKYKEINTELSAKLQKQEETLNVYAEKEAKEREDLLTQLDDQDKEVYGSLSNDQLRKHLTKLQKQPSVNTNTTQPIRDASGNKVKNWNALSSQEKRDNWDLILKSYKK